MIIVYIYTYIYYIWKKNIDYINGAIQYLHKNKTNYRSNCNETYQTSDQSGTEPTGKECEEAITKPKQRSRITQPEEARSAGFGEIYLGRKEKDRAFCKAAELTICYMTSKSLLKP